MKKILATFFVFLYSLTFAQITLVNASFPQTCMNIPNGSAFVNPTGGIPPFSYTWSPSGGNTPSLTAVFSGQYTVQVQDAASNSASLTIFIDNASNYLVNITNNNCTGPCSGSAYMNSFGTSPFTYSWSPSSGSTQSVSNLCTGIYTATSIGNNGCMNSQTFTISPDFSVTTNQTSTNCSSLCNGSATINVNGGTGPFYYDIIYGTQSYSITPIITDMCVGDYIYRVTDATSGCITIDTLYSTAIATSPIPNAIFSINSIPESCPSAADGSLDLIINGSNIGPFNYMWSNGATTQDISNLNWGFYRVTITDNNSHCYLISDTVRLSNCGATNIQSLNNDKNEWNVYPNPSTGVLYIVNSSSVKESSQVQVLNAIGQTVLEETIISNYKNIDLSKLTNGVYFVKITSDKNSIFKRIVLSK